MFCKSSIPHSKVIALCKLTAALCALAFNFAYGQDHAGHFIEDKKTGCIVWFKHMFSEDSVTWSGKCENGYATGKGTMLGYTAGALTSKYSGEMLNGKPNGSGEFTFWGNRKLKGNFSNGEPLFLKTELLNRLKKNVVSETDVNSIYDGDNNLQQLYYHSLLPIGEIKGTVVLMPGTWESTEHLLSSMSRFCGLASENNLAVIVLSINQRLTLNEYVLKLMNDMLAHAIEKYKLPKNSFAIGGWSMGGLFSLRFTEFAYQDSNLTVIKPKAVFSCDGPCDLKNIYNNFERKLNKNPGQNEPAYGIAELEKHCGGPPAKAGDKYVFYSCYSHSEEKGGNAKFLANAPVRIYCDVDPVWWMNNRNVDMYDLNALDQTAMIQLLRDMGNQKAEFINAFQKGVRIEGNLHPHSWSIVEPKDCIDWILKNLNSAN